MVRGILSQQIRGVLEYAIISSVEAGVVTMTERKDITYSGYLQLDRILQAQQPLSTAHDEMLFIIQHQTSELWMKLAIHELSVTCKMIADGQSAAGLQGVVAGIPHPGTAQLGLGRASHHDAQRVHGISRGARTVIRLPVLAIPDDRVSRRQQECRDDRRSPRDKAIVERLEAALFAPSIYDHTIRLLHRRGLGIDKSVIDRDVSLSHVCNESVLNAWLLVYRDPARFWELYELAEKLVDFEDYFRRWRFNHVTTVERVIGFKRGTGGSSGVSYLRKMLDVVLFPELWQARTQL